MEDKRKLKEAAFNLSRIREKTVEINGLRFLVRGLGIGKRNEIVADCVGEDGKIDESKILSHYADVIIECTYDPETRERVFDAACKQLILESGGDVFDLLHNTAWELSGRNTAILEDAKKN